MNGPAPGEDASGFFKTQILLARAQAGDGDAKAELLERYRPSLERFLHSRLPPTARRVHDTHDLVQEVNVRALANLPRLEHRGAGAFWSYLRTIARHHVIEISKREANPVRGRSLPEDSHEIPPARQSTPSSILVRREQLEAFEKSIEALSEKHRQALLLRLELDLDYASIARECDFPSPDAARMAVCRAVLRVGEEMARAGVAE
jgi:RNA polymerase sigma factor (sigma-70 family)